LDSNWARSPANWMTFGRSPAVLNVRDWTFCVTMSGSCDVLRMGEPV
jgi:hypothetical protein